MTLPSVREQIETRLTGTSPTMKNISKPALMELRFPVPDPDTQRALVETLNASRTSVEDKRAEAGLLRGKAWAAFESALFEMHKEG